MNGTRCIPNPFLTSSGEHILRTNGMKWSKDQPCDCAASKTLLAHGHERENLASPSSRVCPEDLFDILSRPTQAEKRANPFEHEARAVSIWSCSVDGPRKSQSSKTQVEYQSLSECIHTEFCPRVLSKSFHLHNLKSKIPITFRTLPHRVVFARLFTLCFSLQVRNSGRAAGWISMWLPRNLIRPVPDPTAWEDLWKN